MSLGNWLEMHTLRPHPRIRYFVEGAQQSESVFCQASRGLDGLQCGNHCSGREAGWVGQFACLCPCCSSPVAFPCTCPVSV